METLEFQNIFKEERGHQAYGRLKVTKQGVLFKNSRTGKVEQVAATDIDKLVWQEISSGFLLRILLRRGGSLFRFGGFSENDFDKLEDYFKQSINVDLKKSAISLKGWNWGTVNIEGSVLAFDIPSKHGGSQTAFEIPIENVSHANAGKNEVTMEFHQNDDAALNLTEMRFYVPPGADGEDTVQEMLEKILAKANIIQATGDAIASFSELQCLTPRGRYDIKIFPTFIQLHGKTFDYKIPLTAVLRMFQLPHRDKRDMYFVLSLDPPIRQGMTRYHFLILLFPKEEMVEIELGLTEAEILDKYDGKLNKEMTGPTYEVIARIMKAIVNRKITMPDPLMGIAPSISCSYKAAAGLLYPLERGFIFVYKPPIHIRFEEIASVNFARSSGTTRSFDFEIETKGDLIHTFSSIEKEEYGKLFDFVTAKNLRIRNRGTERVTDKITTDDLFDSDLEDGDVDPYLARMKQEGRRRDAEDEDESDDDFNPDAEDSGDVAEEFDSDASESDSAASNASGKSDDSAPQKKKQKKQKDKKEKKREKPKKDKELAKKKKKTKETPTKSQFKSKEFISESESSD